MTVRQRLQPSTGRNTARGDGWAAVKAKLQACCAAELLALLRDVYHAAPENGQFLRGRLLGKREVDLEKYRGQVADAVFPDPRSTRPIRIGEAELLIRLYRVSTGDETGPST